MLNKEIVSPQAMLNSLKKALEQNLSRPHMGFRLAALRMLSQDPYLVTAQAYGNYNVFYGSSDISVKLFVANNYTARVSGCFYADGLPGISNLAFMTFNRDWKSSGLGTEMLRQVIITAMDQNLAYVASSDVRDESRSYFSKIGFAFRSYHDVNTELASGKTMADIHKEYGIEDNTIRTWSGAFIAVADLADAGRRDQVLKGLKIPAL